MKIFLSLLLCTLMIAMSLSAAIPVFAGDYDNVIEYSLTNAAGYQNDQITINLNIDKNPGFWAIWVLLYYDADVFNLTNVEYNSDLITYGTFEKTADNQLRRDLGGGAAEICDSLINYNIDNTNLAYKVIMFDSNDLYNDVMFTGTALTLTFTIQGLADDGDYTIGVMPSADNSINCADELLDSKVTPAIVHVGSDKVPADTGKTISPTETLDPSEITEPSETISREDLESRALAESDETTPVETFKGDDGKIYTYDENGETVEYTETETESAATDDTAELTDDITSEDIETVPDVPETGAVEKSESTINLFGKDFKLIYVIGAAILLLAIIAAILAAVIVKTRKKTEKIDDEDNEQ